MNPKSERDPVTVGYCLACGHAACIHAANHITTTGQPVIDGVSVEPRLTPLAIAIQEYTYWRDHDTESEPMQLVSNGAFGAASNIACRLALLEEGSDKQPVGIRYRELTEEQILYTLRRIRLAPRMERVCRMAIDIDELSKSPEFDIYSHLHALAIDAEDVAHELTQGKGKSANTAHADSELLDWLLGIAHHQPTEGGFLESLVDAALRANHQNYPLLRPFLLQMKAKYPKYQALREVRGE